MAWVTSIPTTGPTVGSISCICLASYADGATTKDPITGVSPNWSAGGWLALGRSPTSSPARPIHKLASDLDTLSGGGIAHSSNMFNVTLSKLVSNCAVVVAVAGSTLGAPSLMAVAHAQTYGSVSAAARDYGTANATNDPYGATAGEPGVNAAYGALGTTATTATTATTVATTTTTIVAEQSVPTGADATPAAATDGAAAAADTAVDGAGSNTGTGTGTGAVESSSSATDASLASTGTSALALAAAGGCLGLLGIFVRREARRRSEIG